MKIVLTSDHAGYALKTKLASWASENGHEVTVVGAPDVEAYDYPDAADEACDDILAGQSQFGVFVCGTGTGICMRANRHRGIRAAHCVSPEMARLAREHNHANVLCLGQSVTDEQTAVEILKRFLSEPEDTAERRIRRVQKLDGNGQLASSCKNE